MSAGHTPVLLDQTVAALAPKPEGQYLDATFGGGGHARAILELQPTAQLIALDQDPSATERATQFSRSFPGRFSFFQINFSELTQLDLPPLDGALFDFGLSSFQLDEASRGFSFRQDAPADMRMNPNRGQSAAEFLETATREALVHAIRDLGEEPRWRAVVEAILHARGSDELKQTSGLAQLIDEATGPAWKRKSRLHPATLSFQGIRMAVNEELEVIEQAIPAAFELLSPGGVLATISFHSLEDRIVKRLFREWSGRPVDRRDNRPLQTRTVLAEQLTNRPITPSETEILDNPRSRSARLRVLRKL